MDNTPDQVSQNLSKKDLEKTLTGLIVVTIITAIIAILGAGFGVYGTIQANRTIKYLEDNFNADFSDTDTSSVEETYGKPTSSESIASVYIMYNDASDFVNVYDSNEVEYYTYDENDEYTGSTIEIDSSEIFKYIYDNDLEYLGDNDYDGEEVWSLEVVTNEDTYSYVGGTAETPEWFNDLLTKLNVSANGYQSKALK